MGNIPEGYVDLGYTHTLDKEKTKVERQADGSWKASYISNNNNNAHTGHSLGSVQFNFQGSEDEAKEYANKMLKNENNNDKLTLDPAIARYLGV